MYRNLGNNKKQESDHRHYIIFSIIDANAPMLELKEMMLKFTKQNKELKKSFEEEKLENAESRKTMQKINVKGREKGMFFKNATKVMLILKMVCIQIYPYVCL